MNGLLATMLSLPCAPCAELSTMVLLGLAEMCISGSSFCFVIIFFEFDVSNSDTSRYDTEMPELEEPEAEARPPTNKRVLD